MDHKRMANVLICFTFALTAIRFTNCHLDTSSSILKQIDAIKEAGAAAARPVLSLDSVLKLPIGNSSISIHNGTIDELMQEKIGKFCKLENTTCVEKIRANLIRRSSEIGRMIGNAIGNAIDSALAEEFEKEQRPVDNNVYVNNYINNNPSAYAASSPVADHGYGVPASPGYGVPAAAGYSPQAAAYPVGAYPAAYAG